MSNNTLAAGPKLEVSQVWAALPVRENATIADALRAILATADQADTAAQQHAHNALSTACWHIARGEAPKALARLRRARTHIQASLEGGAA
jgi:hypothetical protein